MLVCFAVIGCEDPPAHSPSVPAAAERAITEAASPPEPASAPAAKPTSAPAAKPASARAAKPASAPAAEPPAKAAEAPDASTATGFLGKLAKGELPEKFAGCGCEVDDYLFASLGEALIYKLNGEVKVEPTRDMHLCFPDLGQLGTTTTGSCSIDGLDLKVQMTVTSVCAPEDEGCEYVGADAVVEATYEGQRQLIRGKGGCGC